MKIVLFTLLLLAPMRFFGQGYHSVYFGKLKDYENKIFVPNRVFSYQYLVTVGDTVGKIELGLQKDPRFKGKVLTAWAIIPNSDSKYQINEIRYTVIPDSLVTDRSNRNQTEVQIICFNKDFAADNKGGVDFLAAGNTGVVENDRNVWIHPPRSSFFKVLNTCPYPYVQLPLSVGKTWSDKMKIGEQWGDPTWATWKKRLHMNLSYEVIGRENLGIDGKNYECFVVKSTSVSEIGKNELLFYFNKQLGFVKMEYDILNKIKVDLNLVDVK
nr:hypothetical protein [uncultured Draconibacterium sp.]